MKKNLFILLLKLVVLVLALVFIGYFVFTGCNSCKIFENSTTAELTQVVIRGV